MLKLILALLNELTTTITHQLISDLLRQGHHVVERDGLTVLNDLQLVFVEDLIQALVLDCNLIHALLGEDLKNTRC